MGGPVSKPKLLEPSEKFRLLKPTRAILGCPRVKPSRHIASRGGSLNRNEERKMCRAALSAFWITGSGAGWAGEVRAVGCPRRPHAASACIVVGERKYDVSDADPLMDRAQRSGKALQMNRQSIQNLRRRQARAPSVRFNPLAFQGRRLPLKTAVLLVSGSPVCAVARAFCGLRGMALAMAGLVPPLAQLISPIHRREPALPKGPIGTAPAKSRRQGSALRGAPLSAKVVKRGLCPVRDFVAAFAGPWRPQPAGADVDGHTPPKMAIATTRSLGPSLRHEPAR